MTARSRAPRAWAALTVVLGLAGAHGQSTEDLYQAHCATCHGADRLGGTGPALLPQNLRRLDREDAAAAIRDGLPATQMPGFGGRIDPGGIRALVEHVYTPLAAVPRWGLDQARATHVVHATLDTLPARPAHDAAPLNLFLVVESGDHHVSVLDGDRLEPIHRFKSRYALHGGPKFSPDGRFAYLSSRDGWVSKFDMYSLRLVAEIRAGINTRNIAASSDGRYVMVANYLPHTLVVLDAADLSPLRVIPVADESGKSSRVSAVYDAPPRESFIAALKDIPEVWEIAYGDDPPYHGMVHDYRVEGPPEITERFPVRRIRLEDYLDDFFFDPGYRNLVGAARDAHGGQVVSLIVGRKIADIDLPGLPHLGSGISWRRNGVPLVATPNLRAPEVSVIDMRTWETVRRIETLGPGFFLRSHEATPFAWVDVFFGPHRDAVHVIDKRTLEIVRTLRPEPGKTAAHVEFDRDGSHALVSIWEHDGAIVVYDARTLEEVKRIPMRKPSGKYNVWNKISGSTGTSH